MSSNEIEFDKLDRHLSIKGVVRLFKPKEKALLQSILQAIEVGELSALDLDISSLLHVDLSTQYFLFKFAHALAQIDNSSFRVTANDNFRLHQLLVTNFYRFNPNTEFTFIEV